MLARYADPSTTSNPPAPVAAVLSRNGKGKALLSSVHFEYPLKDPPARDALARLDHAPDTEAVERSDQARMEWVEELLLALGLKPPGRRKADPEITVDGEEDPTLLLHPRHPSPIFVLSHPALPQLATDSFKGKVLDARMEQGSGGWKVLRDGNDELHIGEIDLLSTAGAQPDVTDYLAGRRREQPVLEPNVESLSLDSTAAPVPQPPDFHSVPKTMLLPSPALPYSPSWTPLFNMSTYWTELDNARKSSGRKTGVLRKDGQGGERAAVGDHMWYGETVTSTQTMLDRFVTDTTSH